VTELICVSSDVMGGMACFAGTRVPIAFVLASLDSGESFGRVQAAYPFLTQAHVAATHETGRPHDSQDMRARWRLIQRRIVRTDGGGS
jgi:uncharacterized protein (DUF433 family)